jgi:predicted AAA+ superfamily ATPase
MEVGRTLTATIQADLLRKLVLVSGPRQVGKTTLARSLDPSAQCLNYDVLRDRRRMMRQEWSLDSPLLILDELHKMKKWKAWLKGVWDGRQAGRQILVTGSARLDTFRRGGESLAGRFLHHHLHPFTVREVAGLFEPRAAVGRLLERGGFPEPFLAPAEQDAARWRLSHVDTILRDDVDAVERVRDIRQLALLAELLAERVGSTISYQGLSEDLSVSPPTVKRWIEILEALCVVFVVRPYARASARSLRKEPKVYFYDTGRVEGGAGARLENLVACHLLARNQFLEGTRGERHELSYVRDKEKREVDFLLTRRRAPELLVEVKSSETSTSKSLEYYATRIACPAVQLVLDTDRKFTRRGVQVLPAPDWLARLEC